MCSFGLSTLPRLFDVSPHSSMYEVMTPQWPRTQDPEISGHWPGLLIFPMDAFQLFYRVSTTPDGPALVCLLSARFPYDAVCLVTCQDDASLSDPITFLERASRHFRLFYPDPCHLCESAGRPHRSQHPRSVSAKAQPRQS
jgi:hypothetical protein